jgi:hypothetical protein
MLVFSFHSSLHRLVTTYHIERSDFYHLSIQLLDDHTRSQDHQILWTDREYELDEVHFERKGEPSRLKDDRVYKMGVVRGMNGLARSLEYWE